MVIKYLLNKKIMKIFSDEKVLSSNFRKWFLIKLSNSYDLYENLNGIVRLLTPKIIEESANLSILEINNLKNFYKAEVDHMSFEEFLDSEKIVFSDICIFDKNLTIDQKHISKDKNLLAIIDLCPDGDSDCMMINIFNKENFFIELINTYNNQNG